MTLYSIKNPKNSVIIYYSRFIKWREYVY